MTAGSDPALVLALVVAVILAVVLRKTPKTVDEDHALVSHSKFTKVIVASASIYLITTTMLELTLPTGSDDPWLLSVMVLFSAVFCPWVLGHVFRSRIVYSKTTVYVTSALSPEREYAWEDVTGYETGAWFVDAALDTRDGRSIYIFDYMSGAAEFARYAGQWIEYNKSE